MQSSTAIQQVLNLALIFAPWIWFWWLVGVKHYRWSKISRWGSRLNKPPSLWACALIAAPVMIYEMTQLTQLLDSKMNLFLFFADAGLMGFILSPILFGTDGRSPNVTVFKEKQGKSASTSSSSQRSSSHSGSSGGGGASGNW